jgi:hypothetical protein
MSRIRIYGDSTGYIEIKAPDVAGNTTVEIPEGSFAGLDSPTFTGTVGLPSTTSIGDVSSTEIGHLDGVTSAIQTQLNAKANLSAGYQFAGTVYFMSNGTFTKATYPWLRAIRVKCQGGGGGAGGTPTTAPGENACSTGGAGGGYAESFITNIVGLSASVTVTVGTGGAGGAAGANNGSAGGNSSFGTLVAGNGGAGGIAGVARTPSFPLESRGGDNTNGGGGGTGDLVMAGGFPQMAMFNGIFGGFGIGQLGGDSFMGRGGRGSTGIGTGGIPYGGGAGGTYGGSGAGPNAGAAGGNGIVIVELYA